MYLILLSKHYEVVDKDKNTLGQNGMRMAGLGHDHFKDILNNTKNLTVHYCSLYQAI